MFSSAADYYTIRLGEYHRIRVEGNEQDIKGKQIITHPGYNSPSPFNNDISLIQLEKPASLNSKVGIVCLPKPNEMAFTRKSCYITGARTFSITVNRFIASSPQCFVSDVLSELVDGNLYM